MKKLMMVSAFLPLMAAADGVCTWETRSNDDGTVTVCGVIGTRPTGVLTIPATCDGKAVTKVGVRGYSHEDGSFANLDITGLVIPDGVTELSDGVFHGCKKLTSVTLPSTLKIIRNNCFEDCSALKSIVLPEGLQRVEFDFLNRTAVSTLNLPSTLVDIDEGALAIPSGRKFTVASGNPRYRIENGYVYDYANKVVFMRADYYQKTFVIPDGALRIAECCFGGCDGGNITIPASVREIGEGAFMGCQGLTVTFLGVEPQVTGDEGIFEGSTSVKVYVRPGQGWDDVVMRGIWQGRPIQYIGSPVLPAIEPSYGPFVPGEKVSLAIPALVGYTAKGLPSGLKLDKKTGEITGAAKKPTGEAGVTVTFTKKNEPTQTAQFVVGPIPTISVTLEGDAEKCKVTGANKAYLVGKKVPLQAKGPKGTAFVGWFKDGEPWPSEEECLDPKIKYVMTAESLNLVARFKAEEVSVACDTSAGCVVKEQVSFPVIVDCESGLKSVSAKKLPSGLKYNKKTGCIEGAAKKAGTYPFSLTVTTKAGSKVTQSFALTVREAGGGEYPDWMVGTFTGGMKNMFYQDQEHRHFICADYAVGTLTVSPNGKCSMRWEGIDGAGDESEYFKPLTFSGKIVDVGSFECHIRIIVPGEDDEWIVTIRKLFLAGQEVGAYVEHFIPTDTGEYELDYDRFVQNIWMRQDMKGVLTEIGLAQTSGFAVLDSSGLFANTRVTVSADGQVKLSGTVNGSSASATGSLIPCDVGVGAEAFESYFIVTAGKWHYPVKVLFVGQGGTWNVLAVDFDE